MGGGSFIRFADEPSAYVTTASLFLDTSTRNWPVKGPLAFEEAEVARVTFQIDGEPISFRRPAEGAPFKGEGLAAGEKAKAGEVSRIVRSLVTARFTDAVEASDAEARAAGEHAGPVTLELFSGESYTLRIGRRPAAPVPQAEETADAEGSRLNASASVVFDGNGEIVSEDLLPGQPPEATANAGAETRPSRSEPGLVFVFYESTAPGFVWEEVTSRAALKFSDHLFDQLPTSRDRLVELIASEEPAAEEQASD